jgi:hypothetical protein
MTQYFEIRNAMLPNGEVIALWRKEDENIQLIFGVKDVVTDEDTRGKEEKEENPFGTTNEKAIEYYLVHEITEPEFSVRDDICEIPHIASDGVLHHLGILKWQFQWHEFLGGWKYIKRHGTVYAKTIDPDAQD